MFYGYSEIIHTEREPLFMAKTKDGHYIAISEYFIDKSICYTLYDKKGYKIPCFTRAQGKKYPKRSARAGCELVKYYQQQTR